MEGGQEEEEAGVVWVGVDQKSSQQDAEGTGMLLQVDMKIGQ